MSTGRHADPALVRRIEECLREPIYFRDILDATRDQKYRAVILHPDEGDVYVLVWVDNHDQAMDWAGKRRFEVLRAWSDIRTRHAIERDEHGRYWRAEQA